MGARVDAAFYFKTLILLMIHIKRKPEEFSGFSFYFSKDLTNF